MTTSQTTIPDTAEGSAEAAAPGDLCVACPHPLSAHDAIEARYCAASTASSSARRCICGFFPGR